MKPKETHLIGWSLPSAWGMMNAAVGSPFWLWATETGNMRMTAYGTPTYEDGAVEQYALYCTRRRRDAEVELHSVAL